MIERRDFLKGIIAIPVLAGLTACEKFYVESEKLTFEEARDLAYRMDAIHDKLPPLDIPVNEANFKKWVAEVVPWFEEEDIVDYTNLPPNLSFQYYQEASSSHHILGRSNCAKEIEINDRMLDESLSSWKNDLNFWGTVVHELAHAQQGILCRTANNFDIESSAQVGMITVLSAMASKNKIALYSLVHELRDMAVASALYVALDEDRLDEFWPMLNTIYSLPSEQAANRHKKTKVEEDKDWYKRVSNWYNYIPLHSLLKAHQRNNDVITNQTFAHPSFSIVDFGYLIDGSHLEQLVDENIRKK